MNQRLNGGTSADTEWILLERPRLVRLCAHLTDDAGAAEDLAQETLYEALRNEHKLYDPSGRDKWLSAIASNVCLRWAHNRARESMRLVRLLSDDAYPLDVDDWAEDDFDLEVELERHELAELLDRAMGLLPPEMRDVLVEEYVEGTPHAETAARLGLTEGAVQKRLQRGRLAMRRILTTELQDEAAAYGLHTPNASGWEETRLWCPTCGRRRLLGRFGRKEGDFGLRCPDCHLPGIHEVRTDRTELVEGVKGYKPAFSRLVSWAREYYTLAMREGVVPCPECGERLRLRLRMPEDGPLRDVRGVHVRCGRCARTYDVSLGGLAFWTPEAQRLWRGHPRIRTLPERELELGGRPALLTRFESLTGSAALDVIHARDTYELLEIHGASGA